MTSTAEIIDLDAYRARRQRGTAASAAPDSAGQMVLPMWPWWVWAFVWVPVPVGSTGPAWQQG
ncbi:hypothetical protein [Bradyrhizobium sp. HKCCYLR20261]|uniref:hypothetical protein n=1 Tax=Bradyrhizobium sp. HKCCYLR20261 TaxID=3420760 RepID=UPI003EB6F27A